MESKGISIKLVAQQPESHMGPIRVATADFFFYRIINVTFFILCFSVILYNFYDS